MSYEYGDVAAYYGAGGGQQPQQQSAAAGPIAYPTLQPQTNQQDSGSSGGGAISYPALSGLGQSSQPQQHQQPGPASSSPSNMDPANEFAAAANEHSQPGKATSGGGQLRGWFGIGRGGSTQPQQKVYKETTSVPKGYHVEYTKKGMYYLVQDVPGTGDGGGSGDTITDADLAAQNAAENEHVRQKLPLNVSLDELEARYGIGTRLYFNFVKFVILCNLILFLLAFLGSKDALRPVMCNYPNREFRYFGGNETAGVEACETSFLEEMVSLGGTAVIRRLRVWEYLFSAAYTRNQYPLFLGFGIAAVVVWFLFGPLYLLLVNRIIKSSNLEVNWDNPFAFSGVGKDEIKGNEHVSSAVRTARKALSYFIFVCCIVVACCLTFGIQYLGLWLANRGFHWILNFVISIGATLLLSLINILGQQLCNRLTSVEKHKTWSSFRKHNTFKLFTFKILNEMGIKFFMIILMDLFVFTLVELILPPLRVRVLWALGTKIKAFSSKGGDETIKPEFDVSEEYLELLYRQYIVFIGMFVFPLITFFALINNCLEYPLDKYRLLRVCQEPHRLDHTMKHFLVLFIIFTAVAGFFCYPTGGLWMLSGMGTRSCEMYAPPAPPM